MKILIAADVYPPEVSSAANLMAELAEGLVKRGHAVTVVTSYPRHYLTDASKGKTFLSRETVHGVDVLRVKTLPLHKVNYIVRGISQLILPFLFFRAVKRSVQNGVDAVIIYSPPLPLAVLGVLVKRRYKARFLLNLQDIFPQNAIDLGILTIKPLIMFFEWIEKIVYKRADVITFHSPGGRKFLIEKKGVPSEKIVTLMNWVDVDSYQRFPNITPPFRERYHLANKFIFLFAGIFGPAQGLEFLMRVAREVQDISDIVFLLVGDGVEKEKMTRLVSEWKLKNVIIQPFIPQTEYPALVHESDVGVVCLSEKNKTSFVPGKLLGYLAAGKPAVSFLNKESDGFEVMRDAQCGYASVAGDLSAAVSLVRKMYSERTTLAKLGESGLAYARKNLALDSCLEKIEKLVASPNHAA
ncbi:MAG: glycosyltransferase family 4 protein [Candidatus Jorgensenbacteria bacterium]|nr:glycosyltransferase family 4 protein [Candidatus Jorgensenbacteria bacterium]